MELPESEQLTYSLSVWLWAFWEDFGSKVLHLPVLGPEGNLKTTGELIKGLTPGGES